MKERELLTRRIPVMMSESDVAAVDDWAWKNRVRTRGEAIRQLLWKALSADASAPSPAPKEQRSEAPRKPRERASSHQGR